MIALRPLRRLVVAVGARIDCVPIRLKLALTFAGMMIGLFGVLSLLLYIQFAAGLDAGIRSSLDTRAADLTATARESNQQLLAHPVLPVGSDGFAQILNPAGGILASTPGRGDHSLLSAVEVARALHARVEVNQGERVQLLAYRPARTSPNVLVVGVSTADRDSALASLQRLLFIGGPIALLIACAAGYVVAARALGPVETMRRRAARMCGFGSDERLPVPRARDEIHRLGETLNEMLARLEEVVERGRAFVAGASHELRTPLTILQLELDEALSGERSDEELREAIGSAREEVRRLTSLAEDLLVIAQSDHQRLPIISERFEVHRAMRVIAERYSHLDGLVGRTVRVEPEGEVFLNADVARLDQALSNMVHNALRFSDGPVIMHASTHEGLVELHVLDRGPGFSPEFLPHAFERFSRADPARSRGGTGLGLAIVRAIAEAHGGRVEAENRAGGGAHVWLTLPGVVASAPAISTDAPSGTAMAETSDQR
ncbi:MAG TPA: ATP-binding protein [Solirubrobacteraceae bacterium]|jgi:signal transduction histidine kinase|nr:ATP-binding protein [Solirubrobacteraceae bacterium]